MSSMSVLCCLTLVVTTVGSMNMTNMMSRFMEFLDIMTNYM